MSPSKLLSQNGFLFWLKNKLVFEKRTNKAEEYNDQSLSLIMKKDNSLNVNLYCIIQASLLIDAKLLKYSVQLID